MWNILGLKCFGNSWNDPLFFVMDDLWLSHPISWWLLMDQWMIWEYHVVKTMSFLPPMTGNGKHTTYWWYLWWWLGGWFMIVANPHWKYLSTKWVMIFITYVNRISMLVSSLFSLYAGFPSFLHDFPKISPVMFHHVPAVFPMGFPSFSNECSQEFLVSGLEQVWFFQKQLGMEWNNHPNWLSFHHFSEG